MIDPKYITRRKKMQDFTAQQATTAHLGLWLEKFLITTYKEPNSNEPRQKEFMDAARKNLIEETHKLSLEQSKDTAYDVFYQRYSEALLSLGATPKKARVLGRMVIGLGNESLWENSLTIHRIYGVPIIPGSALKGLCSSYAHRFLGEKWQKGTEAHRTAFGDTTSQGFIQFFDALPVPQSWSLEREVMTVHHQEYYSNKAAPTDWDDPNPIPFISATGTFEIAYLAPENWQERILEILELALIQEGIGAKTSSGYGRLEFLESPRKAKAEAEQQAQKQHIQYQEALEKVVKRVTDLKSEQQYHQQMPTILAELKRLEIQAQQQAAMQILTLLSERKLLKTFKGKSWLVDLQQLGQA